MIATSYAPLVSLLIVSFWQDANGAAVHVADSKGHLTAANQPRFLNPAGNGTQRFNQLHYLEQPSPETWMSLLFQSEACPSSSVLVPVCLAAACIAAVFVTLQRRVKSDDCTLAESVRLLILLPQFVCLLGSTIIVIDTFDLAKTAGMGPGDSGQLVGLTWAGAGLGFASMWFLLRQRPLIWKELPRPICATGLFVNILGNLLYLYGVYTVERGASGLDAVRLLKTARFVGGLGQGLVAQFMVVTIQSVTASADMGDQMTRVFFVNALGIGSGPVLAAIGHALAGCPSNDFSFLVAPSMYLVFVVGTLLIVIALFPDTTCLELPETSSSEAGAADDERSIMQRKILIMACICLFVLRSFVTSGVEVGSALLLERDFGMDRKLVGVAVGATFMAVIPVRMLYQVFKEGLSTIGWFRLFASSAIAGTLLLSRQASALMPGGAAILLADCIIFPAAFLADGLSYGVLMVNVFPTGSLFDKNNSALFCNALGMALGRLSGPWFVRYQLEALGRAGQDRYALGQMFACMATLLIFEAGVRPGMKQDSA